MAEDVGYFVSDGLYLLQYPREGMPVYLYPDNFIGGYYLYGRGSKFYMQVFTGGFKYANHKRYSGKGYIAGSGGGIVTYDGQPAMRQIYLFALPEMVLHQSTWSDEEGRYFFGGLNTDYEYLVMARDYAGKYAPVSADRVRPVPMY